MPVAEDFVDGQRHLLARSSSGALVYPTRTLGEPGYLVVSDDDGTFEFRAPPGHLAITQVDPPGTHAGVKSRFRNPRRLRVTKPRRLRLRLRSRKTRARRALASHPNPPSVSGAAFPLERQSRASIAASRLSVDRRRLRVRLSRQTS